MQDSVKKYIISRVFTYCQGLQIKDNRRKDGFKVGMRAVIPSSVFDNLFHEKDYLKKHSIDWYVTTDSFPDGDMPCVHFYEYEEEE